MSEKPLDEAKHYSCRPGADGRWWVGYSDGGKWIPSETVPYTSMEQAKEVAAILTGRDGLRYETERTTRPKG